MHELRITSFFIFHLCAQFLVTDIYWDSHIKQLDLLYDKHNLLDFKQSNTWKIFWLILKKAYTTVTTRLSIM